MRYLALALFWIGAVLVPQTIASEPFLAPFSDRSDVSIDAATLTMQAASFTARLSTLLEKLDARLEDDTGRDLSPLDTGCSERLSKVRQLHAEVVKRTETVPESSEDIIWKLLCQLEEAKRMPCEKRVKTKLAFSGCNFPGFTVQLQPARMCLSDEFKWTLLLYEWKASLEGALMSVRNATRNHSEWSTLDKARLELLSRDIYDVVPNEAEFKNSLLALEGNCGNIFEKGQSIFLSLPHTQSSESWSGKTFFAIKFLIGFAAFFACIMFHETILRCCRVLRRTILLWIRRFCLEQRRSWSPLDTNDDQRTVPRRRLSVQQNYELPGYESRQSTTDQGQSPQTCRPNASQPTLPPPPDPETSETEPANASGEGKDELRCDTDSLSSHPQRTSVDLDTEFSNDMREALEREGVDVTKPMSDRAAHETNEPDKLEDEDDEAGE